MVVDSFPSDSDEVRWEFRYESNEFERQRAGATIGRENPRGFLLLVGHAIALVLVIAFWFFVWWAGAWAGKNSERLIPGYHTQDFHWIASGGVSFLVSSSILLSLKYMYSRRMRNKKSKRIPALIKIYRNKEISFVDGSQILRRTIEKARFNDEYIFIAIKGDKRHVYLPRRVVSPTQFDALVEFLG